MTSARWDCCACGWEGRYRDLNHIAKDLPACPRCGEVDHLGTDGAARAKAPAMVFTSCDFSGTIRNQIAEMFRGKATSFILPPDASLDVTPDSMRLALYEPSPVARFDAWAAESSQDRPPPGRRPWGARWER